jgi:hypothetical protein
MKITALANTRPLLTLTGEVAGSFGGVGPSGQVPTSNGSNVVAWGSNVAIITSNSSNALLGPFVNFASGAGIAFGAASNTLTISATGTGGGGGGGSSHYSPWNLPNSPNGSDREGSSAGALTGATDRASVTSSVANGLISVVKAGATGDRLAGTDWAETMADGDHWTIGIQDGLLYQDFQAVGMYVCDSTFTEAWSIALVHDGTGGVYPQLKDWTNTGTGAGAQTNYQNPGIVGAVLNGGIFLRIKRNSATSFDNYISFSGKEFRKLSSALNPGFTIARIGIAAYSAANTVDVACHVRFLRKNWDWGN